MPCSTLPGRTLAVLRPMSHAAAVPRNSVKAQAVNKSIGDKLMGSRTDCAARASALAEAGSGFNSQAISIRITGKEVG